MSATDIGSEKTSGHTERRKFKAEVKQVLDIVIHSLYTHREIFVRELISNASDALEKMRHESLTAEDYFDKEVDFEIKISVDKDNHTFSITDTGIGMTHEELMSNLGTIARSGTREFLESLKEGESMNSDIIGKFGVGFYSVFMVSDEVKVLTRSYRPDAKGYEWLSDGGGDYTMKEAEDLPRGTTIVLKLREDSLDYENEDTIRDIIRKYSNFISFPIFVGDEKVNTVQAVWLKPASDVTEEDYKGFFKFISNSDDDPMSTLHMSADAPIQLSALLYVPAVNLEKFGFMKMKPSVNLYCRKILIQQHTDKLLPEYMRFITGVVDSADLPLNISRETLQDNTVFRKMAKYLTRRVIRHLADEAEKNPDGYKKIWETFGNFIKEGITADFENRSELAKLLRYKTSMTGDDIYTSLEDYKNRMKENQKDIYYINGSSREDIESGPYIEAFKKRSIEVLYLFEPVDDFVMASLMEYDGKKLVSIDSADIELPEEESKPEKEENKLSADDVKGLAEWMNETLGTRVKEVRESKRFIDRPAIIVNPEAGMTATMQRVMKAAGRDFGFPDEHILEINTSHPLIVTLKNLRDSDADQGFLQSCVQQIFDNALAEAGLLDNPRTMVDRVYTIMERALNSKI